MADNKKEELQNQQFQIKENKRIVENSHEILNDEYEYNIRNTNFILDQNSLSEEDRRFFIEKYLFLDMMHKKENQSYEEISDELNMQLRKCEEEIEELEEIEKNNDNEEEVEEGE